MAEEIPAFRLPDGSGFFVAEIDPNQPPQDPVRWNPYNQVVQDHRTGDIDLARTNEERVKRGLLVPWTPEVGKKEVG